MNKQLDSSVKKDSSKNLVYFELDKSFILSQYQLKMMSQNDIEGILKVDVKNEIEYTKFFYQLSSNESLQSFFKINKVSADDFINILRKFIKWFFLISFLPIRVMLRYIDYIFELIVEGYLCILIFLRQRHCS